MLLLFVCIPERKKAWSWADGSNEDLKGIGGGANHDHNTSDEKIFFNWKILMFSNEVHDIRNEEKSVKTFPST